MSCWPPVQKPVAEPSVPLGAVGHLDAGAEEPSGELAGSQPSGLHDAPRDEGAETAAKKRKVDVFVTGPITGLAEWMQPPPSAVGKTSWIVMSWPGQPDHLQCTRPSLQILLDKKSIYVKPVERSDYFTVDKFQGVQITWSRFDGSLAKTLEYAVACGFWPSWTSPAT